MNKSFKGKLASNGTTRIRLSTNNGLIGYQIVKAAVIPETPPASNASIVMQVYSVERSASSTIDFDDPTLLAVALYNTSTSSNDLFAFSEIIDNKKINQDIFVTIVDGSPGGGAESANYYVELETSKLDLNEATVATLKDMRGRE